MNLTNAYTAILRYVAATIALNMVGFVSVESCSAQQSGAAPPGRLQPEWTELFDGESLQGWEGNQEIFRIQEGAIVGGSLDEPIQRNEFLCTKFSYKDFELRLKVRIKGTDANAGIQFRSRRIPNHHEVIGYQADVGQQWWGKLYDESRRRTVLAGPDDSVDMQQLVRSDDWNDYVIRCEGPRVQLWLNGVKTVDYTEREEIEENGVIAVQIHSGPPSEAWYKDIQIRSIR